MEGVSTVKLKFLDENNETIIKSAIDGDKESFIELVKNIKFTYIK
ncbi:hypothetical protein [Clostridium intestinale]|nr:hypothetical protein [Clostridium intestinale]